MHYNQLDPTSFIHAIYIEGQEHNFTIFNNEKYQHFLYDMTCMTVSNFSGELNIQIFLDNGCMLSVMSKSYCDQHEIVHKCQKVPCSYCIVWHLVIVT